MPVSLAVEGSLTRVEGDALVAHMVSLEGTGGLFEVSGEVCDMCFSGFFSKSTFNVLILTPFPEHWSGEWEGRMSAGFELLVEKAKAVVALG